MKIVKILGREVLDSRGNPTVEAEVYFSDGSLGRAICPSGASTGEKEAQEMRDGDKKRYNGKGVLKAIQKIQDIIAPQVVQQTFETQADFDKKLIALDGTPFKSNLGANAILPLSMAFARALATHTKLPLFEFLANGTVKQWVLPVPCMNVINGGKHADNNVDFQEFMIAPHHAHSFKDSIRMGIEVFHTLKDILHKKNYSTGVGDEGGFAPNLKSNEEAIEVILEAIVQAGYTPGKDISLCLDPATSELWDNGNYKMFKSSKQAMSSHELNELFKKWVKNYPILSIEDGMGENDIEGWKIHTKELKDHIEIIGDDYLCTNPTILKKAIEDKICNSILIKLNQIGTVTETLETINIAQRNNYGCMISHRSGETEDTFIADLAVATEAKKIKTGSGCRGERIAKFNQLLRIEEQLGSKASFAGISAFKNKV